MKKADHDALEELLRHASPRPTPSADDEAAVRAAVRAEWRDLTGNRRTRGRVMQYAIAATILIGVLAVFNMLRVPVVENVRVASIEKSIGPVYLLGEEAELRETNDLTNLMSGQTIVTGSGAGLAIAWGSGGSIRVDENSRIEFTDNRSVFLESGRVYFDTHGSSLVAGIDAGDIPALTLRTELGDVDHLGTQYMTEVSSGRLVVSVREGEVSIDGKFHVETVKAGKQATISGRQPPSILSISRSGEAWSWVNRITPPVDVEGRSAYEYVRWAAREMGLEYEFIGQAESTARKGELRGIIEMEPAIAVPLRLESHTLESHIKEGTIYIYETR